MSAYNPSEAETKLKNQLGAGGSPVGRYADIQALAAAGSVIGDAGAITVPSGGLVVVSGANGTLGVRLPLPDADGYVVHLKGTTAGVLKVWPHAGAKINDGSASAAFSLASGKVPVTFIWDATNTSWITFPLVPS